MATLLSSIVALRIAETRMNKQNGRKNNALKIATFRMINFCFNRVFATKYVQNFLLPRLYKVTTLLELFLHGFDEYRLEFSSTLYAQTRNMFS